MDQNYRKNTFVKNISQKTIHKLLKLFVTIKKY